MRIADCGESTKWTNTGAATTRHSRTSLSFAVAVRRRFARPPIRPRARSLICEQRVPIAVPAPYTTGDGVRLSPSFVVIVVAVVVRVAPAARGSARRPRDARQPRSTSARRRAAEPRRVGRDTTARRHSDPGRQHATTRRHDGAIRRRRTRAARVTDDARRHLEIPIKP